MATGPIHPEILQRADALLIQALSEGISGEAATWTVNKLREQNARLLQQRVEGVFNNCVERLHEELTLENQEIVRQGLQRLEFYPTIHGQLLDWIHIQAPNSGLISDLSVE